MFSSSIQITDPSQNFIERYPQELDALFHPQSIAVIGAKDDEGSVGRTIMLNLLQGLYRGKIFPVNPKRASVLGLKSFPSVKSINESIDLAILITPAQTIPNLIAECIDAGVKTAIIISAGFKELGEKGQQLEDAITKEIKRGKIRIIGPNCLGVMNPIFGLNATFAKGMALPGNIAFLSQSGAMCTAVLDWSLKEKIGFSAFVSIGSMIDVDWGTLIDYLGNDPNTHSLLIYMETVGDARAFMTAAREVALEKPIIIIKAGRSEAAAEAAASHTGSLAGSDEVFNAALERIGVLRVTSIAELFNMVSVLSKQPLPKGSNLTIVTNAGGPAVLATDAAVLHGASLTKIASETKEELSAFLPPAWSQSNPIDILGDANAERYKRTLETLANEKNSDGILVILSPQDMTDPTETDKQIAHLASSIEQTFLTSWMGGDSVREGITHLLAAQIPVFDYPDNAAQIFAKMWEYRQRLALIYETPSILYSIDETNKKSEEVKNLFQHALKENRTILTESESKHLLDIYGIATVKTLIATTIEETVLFAEQIGYPIVLKVYSETITHKTDVGGVKLDLKNSVEVERAYEEIKASVSQKMGADHFQGVTVQKMIKLEGYELILGSSTDPQFGPIILFGAGGQLVEVLKDQALAIPPLNQSLAHQLLKKTKIYQALKGVRGRKSIDFECLEKLMIQFSQMIVRNPRIKECDINPLFVSTSEMIALDARIVLHPANLSDAQLPQLAIRPYPIQYVKNIALKNGLNAVLRPIRPEDEQLIVAFHHELSEDAIRQRFFEFLSLDQRVAHQRLIRICCTDYDREWAIVAENEKMNKIFGVARLTKQPQTKSAHLKMIIQDVYHQIGLGTQLLKHLLWIAKCEGIKSVDAHILSENSGMIHLCKKMGFEIVGSGNSTIIQMQWLPKD